jgi:hypothetical protein
MVLNSSRSVSRVIFSIEFSVIFCFLGLDLWINNGLFGGRKLKVR